MPSNSDATAGTSHNQSNPETNPHCQRPKVNKNWMSLNADEEVLGWTHASVYMFGKKFLTEIAILFVSIYIAYISTVNDFGLSGNAELFFEVGSYLTVLLSLVFIAITILSYLKRYYVVTSDKVIRKTKIINKNPDYLPLDKIQGTNIRQQNYGVDQILGYGDTYISTAATGDREMTLKFVPSPYEFKRIVEDPDEFASSVSSTNQTEQQQD